MIIENQYNMHFGWINYPIPQMKKKEIEKQQKKVEPIERIYKSKDSTYKQPQQHIDIYI